MHLVSPFLFSLQTARPKRLKWEKKTSWKTYHGERKHNGGSIASVVNDNCSVVGVVGNDQVIVLEADCLGRHLHLATLTVLL